MLKIAEEEAAIFEGLRNLDEYANYILAALVLNKTFSEKEAEIIQDNIFNPTHKRISAGRVKLEDGDDAFAIYVSMKWMHE